jgi:hypothetical protein
LDSICTFFSYLLGEDIWTIDILAFLLFLVYAIKVIISPLS